MYDAIITSSARQHCFMRIHRRSMCFHYVVRAYNSMKGKGKCQVPVFDMSNRDFRYSFFERLFPTADSDTNPIMPRETLSAGRGEER